MMLYGTAVAHHHSKNMGNGNFAMRYLINYMLVLTVRYGAGSALVMLKNLLP